MEQKHLTILPILKKIPIFKDLSEEDHKEIIKNIKLEYFPPNYLLFSENDSGDKLFIIKTGKIEIFHPKKPEKAEESSEEEQKSEETEKKPVLEGKTVAILGPNEFFGEIALICNEKRTASAKTVEETAVFSLGKEDFLKLAEENQNLATILSEEFLERVKENTKKELW